MQTITHTTQPHHRRLRVTSRKIVSKPATVAAARSASLSAGVGGPGGSDTDEILVDLLDGASGYSAL